MTHDFFDVETLLLDSQGSIRRGDFMGANALLDTFEERLFLLHSSDIPLHEQEQYTRFAVHAKLLRGQVEWNIGLLNDAERNITEARKLLENLPNTSQWFAPLHSLALGFTGSIAGQKGEFQKALQYLTEAVNIAQQHSLQTDLLRWKGNIGNVYRHIGNFEKSLQYLQESLTLAEQYNQPEDIVRANINIGALFNEFGQYTQAFTSFSNALEAAESIEGLSFMALCHNNIGETYRKVGNYAASLEHLHKALVIAEQTGNKRIESLSLKNISLIYANSEKLDKALQYLRKTETLDNERQDNNELSKTYADMASVYLKLDDYEIALDYFIKALTLNEQYGESTSAIYLLGNIGILYSKKNDNIQALHYFKKAYELSEQLQIHENICYWKTHVAEIYSTPTFEEYNEEYAREIFTSVYHSLRDIEHLKDKIALLQKITAFFKNRKDWQLVAEAQELLIEYTTSYQQEEGRRAAQAYSHKQEIEFLEKERALLAQKNADLQEANSFKTKLLGIAAHDLKNPLTNILGAAQLLQMDLQDNPQLLLWSEMIIDSASAMSALITELLESAAADAKAIAISTTFCSLDTLLKKSIARFEAAAAPKEQIIQQTIAPCIAEGDEARLLQVFDNIISNAIKYSPPSTTIYVGLKTNHTDAVITVRDEGQGLTPKDKEQLFQQFTKLSAIPTGGENSTGLGLYIAKHIIELHGGTIEALSEGKDMGTTFRILLPLAQSNKIN